MSKKPKVADVEIQTDENGKPVMRVKVYSAFKSYFDESAYSISAINHTGPFDILPRHHNFMTVLKPCNLDIKAPSGEASIPVQRAIMHVKADLIVVFVYG